MGPFTGMGAWSPYDNSMEASGLGTDAASKNLGSIVCQEPAADYDPSKVIGAPLLSAIEAGFPPGRMMNSSCKIVRLGKP